MRPRCQVFLKYHHVEHLNLMVQQATQRIILLQAFVRGWMGAKRYRQLLKDRERSALVLQSGQCCPPPSQRLSLADPRSEFRLAPPSSIQRS